MVGWHYRLHGYEFEQNLKDSERQRSLACCSPWGCKESETTERLNNNNNDDKWTSSGPVVKNLPANAGDMNLIPSPGRPHMPCGS